MTQQTFRPTRETADQIRELAQHWGYPGERHNSRVIERAIREVYNEEKINMYRIIVHNEQGASDELRGSMNEINTWLEGWSDPENLTATVTDEHGCEVAHKPEGDKSLSWI